MWDKISIEKFLFENGNINKAKFDKGLIFSKYPILGMKVKDIEKFAKILAKDNLDIRQINLNSHEAIILAGMVIGFKEYQTKNKIDDLKYLLPYIDNWASCDTIVPRLKNLNSEEFFFKGLLCKDKPFYIRVGIVWLMKFCLKDNLKEIINMLSNIQNKDYYVKMAISWCYAEAFVYDFDFMFEFIKEINDKDIFKMTLQKVCDSYRINSDLKDKIKKLRKSCIE